MFIFQTLAISAVVPSAHISLTAGVMQAFKCLLGHFGLGVLVPVIALGLVVASLSGLLDWLTGPSTGLLDIRRERGYLPTLRACALDRRLVVGVLPPLLPLRLRKPRWKSGATGQSA